MDKKLEQLPKVPGVYFYKDAKGTIIYVGKAGSLRNRVRSYFQSAKHHDFKTRVMIDEIVDVDWIETGSEVDALFLESAMVKRYQPKFNVLLRDDKQFLYVKITDDEFPRIQYVRRPLDDKAEYFGPFTGGYALKKAMRHLRRSFPYVTHRNLPERACLHYHIGLCPGPEINAITPAEYKKNLTQIKRYLKGRGGSVMRDLEKRMRRLSQDRDYEAAALVRDQLNNLKSLSNQRLLSDRELFDISRDQALVDLRDLLELPAVPRRIECYDVSHIQGTNNVASMVVFTGGVPDRGEYRKFKLHKPGNDDYAHMKEVLSRRLKRWDQWPQPDVVVIDGGKGQVGAAIEAFTEAGRKLPVIGLAKQHEEIIKPKFWAAQAPVLSGAGTGFETIRLDKTAHLLKLLQHIRDEAHRFAVTYHTRLRGRQQTASVIESIPGVGPATRKKLIKSFGSLKGIKTASAQELSEVAGDKQALIIKQHLSDH